MRLLFALMTSLLLSQPAWCGELKLLSNQVYNGEVAVLSWQGDPLSFGVLNFMDEILLGLGETVDVVLSPRDELQAKHYREPKFSRISILEKPLSLAEIASDCNMFIGAGGTMTREMAVLGIPTISVYQDELLDVDRYLIKEGQMIHQPQLTAEFALQYLASCERKPPRSELLQKGRQAYELIKVVLLCDNPPQRGASQDD